MIYVKLQQKVIQHNSVLSIIEIFWNSYRNDEIVQQKTSNPDC